jgi:hypothetical protein
MVLGVTCRSSKELNASQHAPDVPGGRRDPGGKQQ